MTIQSRPLPQNLFRRNLFPRTKPAAPANSGTPNRVNKGASPFTADEEALLAEFTSDLDEFAAEIETPPPPTSEHRNGQANRWSQPARPVLGRSQGAAGAAAKPQPAPQADVVEYASEYRVNCNVCGSMLYAKADQAGKTVKCSDCYSPITIPPPPKIRKKQEINLDEVSTFALKQSEKAEQRGDPYKRSAEQLLNEASQVEAASTVDRYDDTPSVKEWLGNIFGAFADLGVIAHWIGLSVLGSVPAVIALTVDSPILIMGLFPAGFFLGVLVVSCGFAILHAAANKVDSVTDWPTLDPMAWLGQLFVVLAAACVAAIPVWAACQLILGAQLLSVAVTMFSIFALFPFVLLSMLDMNSPFVPFSAEVARSVTKCEEAWGGFYFSSGLVFIALFMTFATATSTMSPPVAAVVCIVAGVGASFVYFSMIGRLAYAIGQAVNAPPRKNDIDRSATHRRGTKVVS